MSKLELYDWTLRVLMLIGVLLAFYLYVKKQEKAYVALYFVFGLLVTYAISQSLI
jgi:hypothetical protein